MSRTLMPCAYRLMIMSSRPPETRPDRLGTSSGSNVPARSRGTSRRTGPIPVCTFLLIVPLREFPELRPAGSCRVIAQVRGQLGLQRPLQHRLDQLAQHASPRRSAAAPRPRPATAPAARPAAGHRSAPATAPAAARLRGIFPAVMSGLPQKPIRFRSTHQPGRDRLLACNGHDRCSPPVTVTIPAGHSVPFNHSLHTWRDTPLVREYPPLWLAARWPMWRFELRQKDRSVR